MEAVETHRESSGHALIAGVGEVEGDGESLRKDGCSLSSCVVAMVVYSSCFRMIDYIMFDLLLPEQSLRRWRCY